MEVPDKEITFKDLSVTESHTRARTHALLVHKERQPDLRLGCLVIFRMSISWASSSQSYFEYAQATYRLAILPQSDGVWYVKRNKQTKKTL